MKVELDPAASQMIGNKPSYSFLNRTRTTQRPSFERVQSSDYMEASVASQLARLPTKQKQKEPDPPSREFRVSDTRLPK